MTNTSVSVSAGLMTHGRVTSASQSQTFTGPRLIALAVLVSFIALAMQPAQAQSPTSDTWKSVAIIGGATAAGAYIGHKIAGPTGTWIGASAGAAAGYAIDRKRRQSEYYRQTGYYDPNTGGYYDPNAGYDPNGGYYPNGPYGGPYNGSAYPGSYPGNSYAGRQAYTRRSR